MSPPLIPDQLALAITVATTQQLRVCRTFGVDRVVLADQLVGRQGISYVPNCPSSAVGRVRGAETQVAGGSEETRRHLLKMVLGRVPSGGVGAVGKWPAAATAESLA